MLRITIVTSPNAAASYYSSADYYLDENAFPARWHGKAAELLGLHGEVAFDHFTALCRNRNPLTGERLTAADRPGRRVAFDFSFSVSKSLSLLHSIAGDDRIAIAFRESVNETMQLIEQEAAVRVRKGKADSDRVTQSFLWADFVHTLSRPVDVSPQLKSVPLPQLHSHVVVLNASYDGEESQWKAAQIGHIKTSAPYYQAVFRAKLAERIQQLGYELDIGKNDFEVRGVPASAIKTFSKRTEEIERLAKKLGITNPESKAKLGKTSRKKKASNLTWEQLKDIWHSMLTHDEIRAIHHTHEQARGRQIEVTDDHQGAFQLALDHLLERQSVVSERDLVAEALRRGLGRVTLEGISEQLDRPDVLKANYDGQPMVTTREVINEELELIEIAKRGRGVLTPISRTAPKFDGHLNAGQQAAIQHLMQSPDRFTSVRGAAGVGKTTLLKSAKQEMESNGYRVTVIAPTAAASRITLRRDGVEDAETLQRFLTDPTMPLRAAGQVVVLDETSLASMKDMLRLARLAEQHDFRVALLGDRAQHKAVSRGNVLTVLEDFGGVRSIAVTEILRQQGELKNIVSLLAEGETEQAFDQLNAMGAIREADHKALAHEYVSAVKQSKSVLAVSPTRLEASQASAAIRDALRNERLIGDQDHTHSALVDLYTTEADRRDPLTYTQPSLVARFIRNKGPYKGGEAVEVNDANSQMLREHASAFRLFQKSQLQIATKDRIRITAAGRSVCGHRLDNGATFTIDRFTSDGNIVLNNGWTVAKDFGHINHDYVTTSYSSQSRTADLVLIAQSSLSAPASNQTQAYVSVSRGRSVQIFTCEKQSLRRMLARPDMKRTAREIFKSLRHRGTALGGRRIQSAAKVIQRMQRTDTVQRLKKEFRSIRADDSRQEPELTS